MTGYFAASNLVPAMQSAFRAHHSTETTMLRITTDTIDAADNDDVTLLSALDLSAAINCEQHQIFVKLLKNSYGLSGCAMHNVHLIELPPFCGTAC